MKRKILGVFFIVLGAGSVSLKTLEAMEAVEPFTASDRVLVIAPHPDDEALGASGAIQSAIASGASVKVVYLTHGESNELSSIFYQKKPMVAKSDFLKIGAIRKDEAGNAMASLGLGAQDQIFLGYPDLGLMRIWQKHWGSAKPLRSFFTRINKVVYQNDFSYGHDYTGENIVHDLERIVLREEPTHIYITAPFDRNPDHQAAYLFLNVVLLNLKDQLEPFPKVLIYLIHSKEWPQPRKFEPTAEHSPPSGLAGEGEIRWMSRLLGPSELEKKKKTILKYSSQVSYSRNFLLSFARANEIYAEFPPEKLTPETGLLPEAVLAEDPPKAGDVRCRLGSEELFVDIPLTSVFDEMGALSCEIFSYKKNFLFSSMPKLSLKLFGKKLLVKNGLVNVYNAGIFYRLEKGRLFIRIPRKILKDPELLFISVRTAKEELSLDFGSWRVLDIQSLAG